MTRRSSRLNGTLPVTSSPSVAPSEEPEDEISCPWIQHKEEKIPALQLPESSSDLVFESEYLFPVAEIYETCMAYYRVIQISPFLFEDFCCALRSPEQTRLLAEIHIAFIRLFIRDDEENQVQFCAQDTNNWLNVAMQLLDGMTYAEILRYYLESDARFECGEIIEILNANYPFVDVEKRITVLKWLCDFFIESYSYRKLLSNEGIMEYESVCRSCGKLGEILLCEGCDACYHVECAMLDNIPEGQWFCQVCQLHIARDVVDSKELAEAMLQHKYRISPLGHDRHGRIYWFFVKRVFIQESETGSVHYYSTLPQLYEVVKQLDPVYYEKDLCANLFERLDDIARQMKRTIELTRKYREALVQKIGSSRDTPACYLDVDNSFRMASILGETFSENVKMEIEDVSSGTALARLCELLQIEDGRLNSTFWSGGANEQQLSKLQNSIIKGVKFENGDSSAMKEKMDNLRRGYRLGFSDGRYREYQNEYSINELAKPFKQRSKERDKKKYLSARFALTDDGEFHWSVPKGRDCHVSEASVCKVIQVSIRKIIDRLPDELLHRLWSEKKARFLEMLMQTTKIEDIRYFLLQLERAIRKPVFTSIWWNSLGLTKLNRVTAEDREERSKLEEIRKKKEKALQTAVPGADPDILFVNYIKPRPSFHTIWRLRDEAFRLNNRKHMGGWLWTSATWVRRFQTPERPPSFIDYLNPKNNNNSPAVKKALRVEKFARKLARWRDNDECRTGALNGHLVCYSPACMYSPLGFTAKLKCYNPNCPRVVCDLDPSKKVKAYKNGIRVEQRPTAKPGQLRRNVLGEGTPFPFPMPYAFEVKNTKKRSLLVIPQVVVKRMARQGGLNAGQYLPGFNKQAKSNTTVWPYPCPRPFFDNCWRFSTLNANTFHALALNLRIMFSCIRWSEMEPEEGDGRVITHFPDHDEMRTITSHRENPPDGYYEQYKMRVHFLSIDDDENEDDSVTYRTGGGSRPRKRKSTKNRTTLSSNPNRRATKTEERWMDGVDLAPYEIASYWARFKRATVNQNQMVPRPTNNGPPRHVVAQTPQTRMPVIYYPPQSNGNHYRAM
ncbi:hypothetical protein M3Y97_00559200 [Aphelenchoides bicaudatus]|nr:hypothetical protein M3Y97_00559200 [Aphelenchoides bicaudatus]